MTDVEQRGSTDSLSSFRSLYRSHYGLVWGTARRFGVEDHQLDDAVQETFLVAYRRMDGSRVQSTKAWLYGITRRVASNYRRAERRTIRRKDALRRTMHTRHLGSAETVEAWQIVDRFVQGLPARKREIFVLSELEGMTGVEIARTLGLRPSTTYDAIRSLRRHFREVMVDAPEPAGLQRMARCQRPEPTPRTWSALVAALPTKGVAQVSIPLASGWAAMSTTAKATILGLTAAAALTVGLAVTPGTTDAPPSTAPDPSAPDPSASAPAKPPAMLSRTAPASAPVLPPSITPADLSPLATARPPTAPAPLPPTAAARPPTAPAPAPPFPSTAAASAAPASPTAPASATPSSALPSTAAASATPASPTAPAPATPSSAPPSLAAENTLLRRASAALAAGDPRRALALADRHAKEHPQSPMLDVSTAVRIESLCALGKRSQARGEARLFLRQRPGSPVAERIEAVCPRRSTRDAVRSPSIRTP